MRPKAIRGIAALFFSALAFHAAAGAAYKYLDVNGNVAYSDELPKGSLLLEVLDTIEPKSSEVESSAVLPASNALIDQLSTTADRLKEDRQAREAQRLAIEQAKAAGRQQQLPPVVYRDDRYYPYYPSRHYSPRHYSSGYKGLRSHHRHKHHNSRLSLRLSNRPFPDIYRQSHQYLRGGRFSADRQRKFTGRGDLPDRRPSSARAQRQ